jgi:uncharacterized membrane protein required for colicin V production
MMSIITLIIMVFFGFNGKNRGVVNYKFSVEKLALTLGFMPKLGTFIKERLIQFIPETFASILGVLLGFMIVFFILTYILGKITKIPEYEYTGADRTLGFFVGMLKGFCVVALLVILYGVSFLDSVSPEGLTKQMKNNFVNGTMSRSIDYYRTSVYTLYIKSSNASVEDLYVSKDALLAEEKVVGYIPWTEGYVYVPPAPEPEEKEDEKKKDNNLPDLNSFK